MVGDHMGILCAVVFYFFYLFFFFFWIVFPFFFPHLSLVLKWTTTRIGREKISLKRPKVRTLFFVTRLQPSHSMDFSIPVTWILHIDFFFSPSLHFFRKRLIKSKTYKPLDFQSRYLWEGNRASEAVKKRNFLTCDRRLCDLINCSPCPNSLVLCSLTRWIERKCLLRRSYIQSF